MKKGVQFNSLSVVELKSHHYFYPAEANFPVIDSFVFISEGSGAKVALLCFQMTVAKSHETKNSKLMELIGRFEKQFRYKNEPLEIVQHAGKWMVKHSTGPLELDVHLIYIVSNEWYEQFHKQDLQDTGNYDSLWNTVHQYKCRPPSKDT